MKHLLLFTTLNTFTGVQVQGLVQKCSYVRSKVLDRTPGHAACHMHENARTYHTKTFGCEQTPRVLTKMLDRAR